jgi:hypothetical protein
MTPRHLLTADNTGSDRVARAAARWRILLAMEPTPREQLPYIDDDVAHATQRLRGICEGLPEMTERLSHGSVTFFVRGKRTVAYLTDDHHGDGRLALVCAAPPGVQAELVANEPDRFFRPPYVGHRGWIGLRLDVDPDWEEVAAVVRESYRCVAPRTLVTQLDGGDGQPTS